MKFLIGLLVDFDQSPAARRYAWRWSAEWPPPAASHDVAGHGMLGQPQPRHAADPPLLAPPKAAARFSDHLPGQGIRPSAAGPNSPAPAPPERGRIVDLLI